MKNVVVGVSQKGRFESKIVFVHSYETLRERGARVCTLTPTSH